MEPAVIEAHHTGETLQKNNSDHTGNGRQRWGSRFAASGLQAVYVSTLSSIISLCALNELLAGSANRCSAPDFVKCAWSGD